jgi:hypothetical protein
MAIDRQRFWGTNFYKHPPLTDRMIAEAEAALGVRLPVEFIELLRIQNGGYTQGFAHPTTQKTSWADDHVPLRDLAGIVADRSWKTAQNILLTEYMTKEWGLPARQVLLSGQGHFWITLDYRDGPSPSVAWIDVEVGEDIQIAKSFGWFLCGLVPASNFDVT